MGSSLPNKIHGRIKFLFRKQLYLDSRERKLLSSSLVQPLFDYACNSWYIGLTKKLKTRFQTAQNKLVRYILGLSPRQSLSVADFNKLNWLNVDCRVSYLQLSLMYSIHCNTAPSYMCNVVPVRHAYNTRRSDLSYVVPHVKSHGAKSFQVTALKLWNNLPLDIKSCQSQAQFKKLCKQYCVNEMVHHATSEFI